MLRQARRDDRRRRGSHGQSQEIDHMTRSTADEARELLAQLGVASDGSLVSRSPIDGQKIGSVAEASAAEVTGACDRGQQAFLAWRTVPAPRRGELVRLI